MIGVTQHLIVIRNMRLPKGITGFSPISDSISELNDAQKLKRILGVIKAFGKHHIIGSIGLTSSSNYYRIKLIELMSQDDFDLLINPNGMYACCVDPASMWMNLKFMNVPGSILNFLSEDLIFLSKDILTQPIKAEYLEQLAQEELEQIYYWKTTKFGEVIFNGYD